MFKKISIIGLGLIGSSLINAIRSACPDIQITGYDASADIKNRAIAIDLIPAATGQICDDAASAVNDADLVILCVPVGASAKAAAAIVPHMKQNAVLSDVGSVKKSVIEMVAPIMEAAQRPDIIFIPAHPIAGTENSGPEAGFATLFKDRWCILTLQDDDQPSEQEQQALERLKTLWESFGSNVEVMSPEHHDRVLGITSHLPHLIAYTIVGTATDLEDDIKSEVIKFSASGFRDFTRIAASDPTMWRDIFLHNREAVLDILQRFNEDLTALQKSIRRGEGDQLYDFFTKTREIRRGVVDAGQHVPPKKD